MSKKVRRNISLDVDVDDAVTSNAENFSRQVNEWAGRRYRDGEFYVLDRSLIQRMIDTVETHRTELHEHIDEQCDELVAELQAIDQHIEEETNTHAAADEYTLEGVAETLNLHRVSREKRRELLDAENPAIRRQAEKVGVEPSLLVEQLAEVL